MHHDDDHVHLGRRDHDHPDDDHVSVASGEEAEEAARLESLQRQQQLVRTRQLRT